LRATTANLESIFLLAPDPDRMLSQALVKRASGMPAARAELDGVGIRLWVVSGRSGGGPCRPGGPGQLYIATAITATRPRWPMLRSSRAPTACSRSIVSAGDPGLTILPTHRIHLRRGT